MNWYLKVFRQYADFSGRARRTEYWMFALFNIIIGSILLAIDLGLGTYGALYSIYGLVVLIPGLAVAVRRLHDVGKSGWFLLVGLIPIIGAIWLLILMVTDSQIGSNKWGENPKGMNMM